MSKGFSGMPGNMHALIKQAQKMQEQVQKMQEEADGITAEGSSGGGMVKVVSNGKNQIVSVMLDPQVVNPSDIEMLQDLVVAAVNDSLVKVQKTLQEKLAGITGGVDIPGLF